METSNCVPAKKFETFDKLSSLVCFESPLNWNVYHVGKFTLSARVASDLVRPLRFIKAYTSSSPYRISSRSLRNHISVCACLFVSGYTHIYIYGYINICIYTCIYVYKNQCTCPSMQGMCLCLVYHVCNTILTYCWLPSVFFR